MRSLLLAICCFSFLIAPAQGFLKTSGPRIVDEKGNEVIFRGIGLGGWMLQEPYMMKLSGIAYAQHDIREKISALIGPSRTKKFYDTWLKEHCTKKDIDSLAAWGFNSVRLPMHYELFTLPVEKEPVKGKQTWLKKGFEMTDQLLSWCAANKIYLILDLHAAPGGQGNDNAIADRDTTKASLWDDPANQEKTIALWRKLAERYVNEPWIGGYDLINEPNWGFSEAAGRNGCNEEQNKPLRDLLQKITATIREVDKNHMIFIEGNCWGNNYKGIFPLWDDNTVISFHKYWNYNDRNSIQGYIDYRQKYNVPVWLGETGENSNAWFTDLISLIEANGIGWNMWPLKKSGLNNLLEIKMQPGLQAIYDHWSGKGPKPNADKAYKDLMEYARNTSISRNIIQHDVIDAMNRQVHTAATIPYKMHVADPGAILYAVDYDIGRSGEAYHDLDSAEYWVSTNNRTGWNQGGQYRNDGVDIEKCNDVITNGYSVGWIEADEWLQYSVYVPENRVMDLEIRTAAESAKGRIQLLVDGDEDGRSIDLPVTGKFQEWRSSTIPHVNFKKGWNKIRVKAITGGFNLNYIKFTAADPNKP